MVACRRHLPFRWNTLANLGESSLTRGASGVLAGVPLLSVGIIYLDAIADLTLFGRVSLPLGLALLNFSSLLVFCAKIITQVCCPDFVHRFRTQDSFKAFLADHAARVREIDRMRDETDNAHVRSQVARFIDEPDAAKELTDLVTSEAKNAVGQPELEELTGVLKNLRHWDVDNTNQKSTRWMITACYGVAGALVVYPLLILPVLRVLGAIG